MPSVYPPGLRNVSHSELRDPAALYDALQRAVPLKHCRPLVPDPLFRHLVGALALGQSHLVSQSGAPTEFVVENTPDLHLILCFQGSLQLQTDGGDVHLEQGAVARLPTGSRCSNGGHSLASITVPTAAVTTAAAAIAGGPEGANGVCRDSGVFPVLHWPTGSPTAQMVRAQLRAIDQCVAVRPDLPRHLGLDDVIHRCVASWLKPQLLSEEPPDLQRWRERAGRGSFDELLDHIRANLHQPLRLSDLETRSHYSRRALQYAFKERLGCSPKQWIRDQRLNLARALLSADGQRPSVREVALSCGYAQMGHFSRDFKARFGLTPSSARRQ